MGTYWYFEFHVHDPVTGYTEDDYSIASSNEAYFPISSILCWKDEEFGERASIQIKTVLQISETMYNDLLPRIERELDNEAVSEL